MATVDQPGWDYEREQLEAGRTVAGCDEAGRGPLAGPVVAAAVILPPFLSIPGLADSKQLTADVRLRLYHVIRREALAVGVGQSSPEEIDRLNILRASLLAMRRAVARLGALDLVLVDGNRPIPDLPVAQQTVVKGDAKSMSIAAASIIAKVTRDAILERLDRCWPGYGFAGHKGYPAPEHLAALRRLGACPAHRASFGPVRAVLAAPPPLPPARSRGATVQQLALFDEDELG